MNYMKYKGIFAFFGLFVFFLPVLVFAQTPPNPNFTERCREPDYGWASYLDLRDCSFVIASCQAISNTTYNYDSSVIPSIVTCRSLGSGSGTGGGTGGGNSNGTFVPLVGIPGVNPDADFGTYINALYVLSISLAALLAVIKIIVAGVKWMLTDVVTRKEDAKKDIQAALTGLLIIISAVVILTTINPNLVKFNLLPETTVTTP